MWPFKKKEEDSQAAAVKAHDHMRRIGRWHLDEKVLGEGARAFGRARSRAAAPRTAQLSARAAALRARGSST